MTLWIHAMIMALGVFISSVAQVLLKKSAGRNYENLLREYMNWMVITGYGMMLLATVCSVMAYRVIPISMGMVLDSMGYIFVTVFGNMFFKETLSKRRLLALLLIILGIMVYFVWGCE